LIDKGNPLSDRHFGLDASVLSRIIHVFEENPCVDEVILYGSRAKGTNKPGSDVDLALKGESLNLQQINRMSLELDDLLLPYTFDLTIYHRIDDPDLIEHIERVGKTIYKRP
jgi:predicted nucleotidyltransferase